MRRSLESSRSWRLWSVALSCAALLPLVAAERAAAEAPTPDGRGRLPMLTDETGTMEASGRIASSTRGQPGPVRLVLELENGESLAVLVAPDALCSHLGLSLQPGEKVTVIGQEVKGSRPLLVARTVVADGKRIAIRDAAGSWLEVPKTSPEPSPPAEGGLPKGE